MVKSIFRVELIKLAHLRLWLPFILPLVLVHSIVLFNSFMQGSLINTANLGEYKRAVLMNWYVFFMIFSMFFLCYQYWRIELNDNCWNKVRTLPISIEKVIAVKLLIVSSIFLAQTALLFLTSSVGELIYCSIGSECIGVLTRILKEIIYYVTAMTPGILITCIAILALKKMEYIAGLSVLISVLNLFTRDTHYGYLNIWAWPYLIESQRVDVLDVVIFFTLVTALLILTKKSKVNKYVY